jgi:hypothetical protein
MAQALDGHTLVRRCCGGNLDGLSLSMQIFRENREVTARIVIFHHQIAIMY